MNSQKVIVVSAVSLIEGGPLTVLRECLQTLSNNFGRNNDYKIIAIVCDKKICEYPNVEYLCFPNVKRSWIKRIYFEYFFLKKLSLELHPYLWISLHDMTPNVISEKQAVYCHNPAPFYKTQLKDLYFSNTVFIFSLFYKYLYKINLKKNSFVIVQQNWIKDAFSSMFDLPEEKIIVAAPILNQKRVMPKELKYFDDQKLYRFFYPALPRVFKNFELLCESAKILSVEIGDKFEVIITINGEENRYARWIYKKYKNISQIKFVGLLSHDKMEEYYQSANCLVFPSKLETWGLPISEFIPYKRPILVSDLLYAHETVLGAEKVDFFDVNKAENLAEKMRRLINGDQNFLKTYKKEIDNDSVISSWENLFEIILKE